MSKEKSALTVINLLIKLKNWENSSLSDKSIIYFCNLVQVCLKFADLNEVKSDTNSLGQVYQLKIIKRLIESIQENNNLFTQHFPKIKEAVNAGMMIL